ncbi:MAG: hypothetical protein WBP75_09880 [Candidatus Cybelea sp.]
MTPEHLEASIKAAQCWARNEIERLVYDGTRPVSVCGTVEAATREAAIARGNAIAHTSEIAEIESVLTYVSECLSADLSHEERPAAPSALHERALQRFTR